MSIYTVKKISEDTGLSRRMVLKHLNGNILPAKKNNKGYEIDDNVYEKWSNNIPNTEQCESNTEFALYENNMFTINNENIIEEVDISQYMDDIEKGFEPETESNLTFADFFSGAGGISCGFAAAGYRPLVFVDNFKEATQTYREYFSNILGFNLQQDRDMLDITEENTKNYVIELLNQEHPYVICGGFPCQGFSLSGTSIATDPRNTLYSDMLEMPEELAYNLIMNETPYSSLTLVKREPLNGNTCCYYYQGKNEYNYMDEIIDIKLTCTFDSKMGWDIQKETNTKQDWTKLCGEWYIQKYNSGYTYTYNVKVNSFDSTNNVADLDVHATTDSQYGFYGFSGIKEINEKVQGQIYAQTITENFQNTEYEVEMKFYGEDKNKTILELWTYWDRDTGLHLIYDPGFDAYFVPSKIS